MPKDKAQILEIFSSIQGEGKYAGVKQVFVRFFKCNIHCDWCDTPHSIGDTSSRFNEYTQEKLLAEIDEQWDDCHSVTLTGGEPLIQTDFIEELLPALKEKGRTVHLETNGIYYQELERIIKDIDVVAMDIKLPSSTKCEPFWEEHKQFLKTALQKDVFIKTVVTSDTDQKEVQQAVDLVAEINPEVLFILQPNSFELNNGVMKRCLDFHLLSTKKLNNVRIMPQMHKYMKIR